MSNVPNHPEDAGLLTKVEDLIAFLARPHMEGILYAVGRLSSGPVRFNEIMALARTSPSTVTARLKEAVAAGLLERRSFDEIPPRVEYAPTQAMWDLEPALRALSVWCATHTLGPAPPGATGKAK